MDRAWTWTLADQKTLKAVRQQSARSNSREIK